MITFVEAKRLSEIKWKKAYNNPSHNITWVREHTPELKGLYFGCGFCERYHKENSYLLEKYCPLYDGKERSLGCCYEYEMYCKSDRKSRNPIKEVQRRRKFWAGRLLAKIKSSTEKVVKDERDRQLLQI